MSEKRNVTVTVSSQAGCGKTEVIFRIADALHHLGYEVDMGNALDELCPVGVYERMRYPRDLSEKIRIIMREQYNRIPSDNARLQAEIATLTAQLRVAKEEADHWRSKYYEPNPCHL
jgi:hypothetical protein